MANDDDGDMQWVPIYHPEPTKSLKDAYLEYKARVYPRLPNGPIWDVEIDEGGYTRHTVEPLASDKQVGGDHYKSMKIQPGHFVSENNLPWYEANAIKYLCRHKMKGNKQDLEKAIHYIQLAIERDYS